MAPSYLKRDMLVAQPDFQFLPAIAVLFWPFRVVFPASCSDPAQTALSMGAILHDLRVLDDALDL